MLELSTEVLHGLSGYPIIQAAAAVLVLLTGLTIIRRGDKERKASPHSGTSGMPAWSMYGPVHDAMAEIYTLSAQAKAQTKELEGIAELLRQQVKDRWDQTNLLEDIRNNQVMRSDADGVKPTIPKRNRTPPSER